MISTDNYDPHTTMHKYKCGCVSDKEDKEESNGNDLYTFDTSSKHEYKKVTKAHGQKNIHTK